MMMVLLYDVCSERNGAAKGGKPFAHLAGTSLTLPLGVDHISCPPNSSPCLQTRHIVVTNENNTQNTAVTRHKHRQGYRHTCCIFCVANHTSADSQQEKNHKTNKEKGETVHKFFRECNKKYCCAHHRSKLWKSSDGR